jgi:hypothetical protein
MILSLRAKKQRRERRLLLKGLLFITKKETRGGERRAYLYQLLLPEDYVEILNLSHTLKPENAY